MSVASWVNAALPRLPGAMKPLVEAEAVKVVQDFCKESTAWRDMLFGFGIVASVREIPLTVDGGTQAVVGGILRVYYERRQLTPFSHAPYETTSSVPTGYSTVSGSPDIINLMSIPSQSIANAIDAYVYLKPVDATSYLPELLTDEYWEYIFDGLMGRMYMEPNKPYTDATSTAYHLRRYHNGKQIAKDKANRGFTSNAQNWTFPSFGR